MDEKSLTRAEWSELDHVRGMVEGARIGAEAAWKEIAFYRDLAERTEQERDEARRALREIAALAEGRYRDGITLGQHLWGETLMDIAWRARVAGGPEEESQ